MEALFFFSLAFLLTTWSLLLLREGALSSSGGLRSSLEDYLDQRRDDDTSTGLTSYMKIEKLSNNIGEEKRQTQSDTVDASVSAKNDKPVQQPPRRLPDTDGANILQKEKTKKNEYFVTTRSIAATKLSQHNATDSLNTTKSEPGQTAPQETSTVPAETAEKNEEVSLS